MNFYHRFAREGLRPDGRGFSHARVPAVASPALSPASGCVGSATAAIGGTVVAVGVSAAPLPPAPQHCPSLLEVRVVLSSGSSPRHRLSRGGEAVARARELCALLRVALCDAHAGAEARERAAFFSTLPEASQLAAAVPAPALEGLQRLVPRSGVVELASLCCQPSGGAGAAAAAAAAAEDPAEAAARLEALLQQRVRGFWGLCVEAVVLADDGSVEDALVLAATAALASVVLPAEGAAPGGAGEGGGSGAGGHRLRLRALPVATTFALVSMEGQVEHAAAAEGSSSSSGGSGSALGVLCVADPSVSNGEDLAPQLLPMSSDSGSGGGLGAALSLAGLGARGLAGAHFTLVCDAAQQQAEGQEAEVVALRKLGGLALGADALRAATGVAAARARASLAQRRAIETA